MIIINNPVKKAYKYSN